MRRVNVLANRTPGWTATLVSRLSIYCWRLRVTSDARYVEHVVCALDLSFHSSQELLHGVLLHACSMSGSLLIWTLSGREGLPEIHEDTSALRPQGHLCLTALHMVRFLKCWLGRAKPQT